MPQYIPPRKYLRRSRRKIYREQSLVKVWGLFLSQRAARPCRLPQTRRSKAVKYCHKGFHKAHDKWGRPFPKSFTPSGAIRKVRLRPRHIIYFAQSMARLLNGFTFRQGGDGCSHLCGIDCDEAKCMKNEDIGNDKFQPLRIGLENEARPPEGQVFLRLPDAAGNPPGTGSEILPGRTQRTYFAAFPAASVSAGFGLQIDVPETLPVHQHGGSRQDNNNGRQLCHRRSVLMQKRMKRDGTVRYQMLMIPCPHVPVCRVPLFVQPLVCKPVRMSDVDPTFRKILKRYCRRLDQRGAFA